MIKRLGIIGVGLIGGSLALALKKNNYCEKIIGCGRNVEHLKKARDMGMIDEYQVSPALAVSGCDVVVLAVPVGAMLELFKCIGPALPSHAVISDVGSVKVSVLKMAKKAFGQLPAGFVPAHPIAGHEKSGLSNAQPDLYQGRRVIVTPHENNGKAALTVVTQLWEAVGAEVQSMEATVHDQVLAATSHLPHLLAFSLVRRLANNTHQDDIFRYAAGGLRDFTRIAESDPVMWRDICLHNNQAISEAINDYRDELDQLQRVIQNTQDKELYAMFCEAQQARIRFRQLLDSRDCQVAKPTDEPGLDLGPTA